MMVRFFLTAFLLWGLVAPAFARSIHGSGAATTGSSQINVGEVEGAIVNVLKAGINNFTVGYNPGEFDDNGYPKAGSVTVGPLQTILMSTAFTGPTTTWVFVSPATRGSFIFFIGDPINVSSISAGCGHSGSTTITQTAGQSCRVEFTFSTPQTNLQIGIGAGSYTGGTGEIAMFRKGADETDYNAGIYWTREYRANLQTLNPRSIRTMPWMNGTTFSQFNSNLTNQVNWAERSKSADLFWTSHFPTATWGGAISGTDQYTIAAAPGTAATWVANEVIQGKFSNAPTNITITGAVAADASHCATATVGRVCLTVSSAATLSGTQAAYIAGVVGTTEANGKQTITKIDSTHVALNSVVFVNAYSLGGFLSTASLTITGKSGGAKLLLAYTGTPFYYSNDAPLDVNKNPSGLGTMYYNDLQDVVIWSPGGVSGMPPIEAQIQLANIVRSNLWISIPPYFTVAAAQSMAAQVRDTLSPTLIGYFEYGNELWNGNFPATVWAVVQGIELGFPFGNNEALHGWYGLRTKQMMDGVYSTWTSSRSAATLRRVFAHQAYGSSDVVTYRMNGGDLNTSLGYTRYNIYVGTNYNAPPNRPIDVADVEAYATYFSGANMVNFDGTCSGTSCGNYTSASTAFLQNLATLYSTGVPADLATAKALLDNDFRQGTTNTQSVTVGGGTTFTASGVNFSNNQTVVGTTTGTFFTGLSLNTPYFVVNVSGSTFKLAATQGGAALTGISGGSGTQSMGLLGGSNNQTLLELATLIYRNALSSTSPHPGWEEVAVTYDLARAGFNPALAPLRMELYEGALETTAPSAITCSYFGIAVGGSAATAAADLAALLLAYKNDPAYGRSIVTSQFQQFMGQDASSSTFGQMTHSKTPSWFLDAGPTQWSLMNSDIGVADYYQLYYGFSGYSSGVNWLLKRDLDPASNDNDPMWLAKAA